jgi:hypothetical protein
VRHVSWQLRAAALSASQLYAVADAPRLPFDRVHVAAYAFGTDISVE